MKKLILFLLISLFIVYPACGDELISEQTEDTTPSVSDFLLGELADNSDFIYFTIQQMLTAGLGAAYDTEAEFNALFAAVLTEAEIGAAYDTEAELDALFAAVLTEAEIGAAYDTEAELDALFAAKESSTSNNIDPDRLSGDTTDDNLVDTAILGPFGAIGIDTTPDSDDTYGGITLKNWNCGESIAQWDAVYLDGTEGEWMIADADAVGKFPARGVAVAACTNGNPGIILVQGIIRNDGWDWTNEGVDLWLGDGGTGSTLVEVGSIPNTSGDGLQLMGWTIDDDDIYINPSTNHTTVQ